jgi:hypothetical protein
LSSARSITLCLFGTSLHCGSKSRRSTTITSQRLHHAVPYALHHAARSPSRRTLSITPHALHHAARSLSHRSIKPRTPSSHALCSPSLRRVRRVHAAYHHPPRPQSPATNPAVAAISRPLSVGCRSHLPGQPSVISRRRACSHRGTRSPRSPRNAAIAAPHRAHSHPPRPRSSTAPIVTQRR